MSSEVQKKITDLSEKCKAVEKKGQKGGQLCADLIFTSDELDTLFDKELFESKFKDIEDRASNFIKDIKSVRII